MSRIRRVAMMINLEWPMVHHHQVFAGIQRYARQCGHWECSVNPYAELLLPKIGRNGGWDGIVARATPRLAELARKARVPLVNVWLNTPAKDLPSVVHDARESGRMAARHLLERGFRRFGYLGRTSDRGSRLQLAGFRSVLSAAGCDCTEKWVGRFYARTPGNWREFQKELGYWIDDWQPPIGIFSAHDLLARYLAEACRQRRLEIPYPVALVGSFNEAVVAIHSDPALSSVDFGFERIGYRAAELLDEMMDGARQPPDPIRLAPAELVARQSSNAFSVNDPLVGQALQFISTNCHHDIDVEAVAGHVITTRRTLARLFQKSLGSTVHETITRMRLDRVKHQLIELNTAIKTVAKDCGFRNAIHLCKVFQRVEGVSPSEYRAIRTTRLQLGATSPPD